MIVANKNLNLHNFKKFFSTHSTLKNLKEVLVFFLTKK